AREHDGNVQGFRQLDRHILHRMEREIRAAVEQRLLELLDEETLAADLRERTVEEHVAGGLDRNERDVERGLAAPEQIADVARLPQRELAAARRDADWVARQRSSLTHKALYRVRLEVGRMLRCRPMQGNTRL